MTPETTLAITQLVERYPHIADAAKFQPTDSHEQRQLELIFTEDAVFDATAAGAPEPYRGLTEIRAMFAKPKPNHTPAHVTTNVYVYEDGGTVRVKSKFLATYWDRDGMRMGDYDDVVVEGPDGWRIRERVLTIRQT